MHTSAHEAFTVQQPTQSTHAKGYEWACRHKQPRGVLPNMSVCPEARVEPAHAHALAAGMGGLRARLQLKYRQHPAYILLRRYQAAKQAQAEEVLWWV